MTKGASIVTGVIIVAILVVGGFALFHKSNTKPATTTSSTKQNAAPAVNNAVLTTKNDPSVGQYLADPSGKPLYTYNADSTGVSNCTGSCLANWPAYQATGSTTNLPAGVSTIKRSDNGQTQYTYNGMPLYYFTDDSAGRVTGDGVENFSVAKPAAASSSSNSTTTAPSTSTQPSSNSQPYSY